MYLQITRIVLLSLLVIVVSACAPATVAPEAPPSAVATVTPGSTQPVTSVPASTVAPVSAETPVLQATGRLLAGIVTHAGQPVPNARVELREPGWVISQTPAVAAAQADHQGAFNLPNPPVGDYSIVGIFPDGEADEGGWPAVAIAAGEEITGVLVPLERKLVLLSPIGGVTVAAFPTLAWQAAEDAASYRLWVIDAGTTALVLDQIVTEATAPITRTLEPGTYNWVVNGLNAAGDLVASGTDTFVVEGEPASPAVTPQAAGAAEGLPPTCQPRSGQSVVYADRQRGFCFLYPAGFVANAIDPGQINVIGVVQGPALDASPDPLAATLLIEVMPDGSADLEAAVAAMVREFHGQPG